MSTKHVDTAADLARYGCSLRIECSGCGAARTMSAVEVVKRCGPGDLARLRSRLRCERLRDEGGSDCCAAANLMSALGGKRTLGQHQFVFVCPSFLATLPTVKVLLPNAAPKRQASDPAVVLNFLLPSRSVSIADPGRRAEHNPQLGLGALGTPPAIPHD